MLAASKREGPERAASPQQREEESRHAHSGRELFRLLGAAMSVQGPGCISAAHAERGCWLEGVCVSASPGRDAAPSDDEVGGSRSSQLRAWRFDWRNAGILTCDGRA